MKKLGLRGFNNLWTAACAKWQQGSAPGSLAAPRTPGDDPQAGALPSVTVGVAEGIWTRRAPCLRPSTQVDKCRPALLPATSQRPRRPGCPDAGPRLGSSAAAEPEGAGFIEMRPATRSRARPSGVRCLGWPDEQMTFVLHAPPPSQLENISIRSQPQRCRSGGFPAQERPSPVAGGQMSC